MVLNVDKEWFGMNIACDVALGTGYVYTSLRDY
jgi:hypothetical protein